MCEARRTLLPVFLIELRSRLQIKVHRTKTTFQFRYIVCDNDIIACIFYIPFTTAAIEKIKQ